MRRTTITLVSTAVLLLAPAGAASAAGGVSPSDAPSASEMLPGTGGDTSNSTSTSSSTDDGDKTGLWGLLGLLGLLGLVRRRETDTRTPASMREDMR